MPLPPFNAGSGPNAGDGDRLRDITLKANQLSVEAEARIAALESLPPGGGGSGNIDDGTAPLQTAQWNPATQKWEPVDTVDLMEVPPRKVELTQSTALARATHNDSLLIVLGGSAFTLDPAQVGAGMHFLLHNSTATAASLTFGSGTVVRRIGAGGTGQTVPLEAYGALTVACFPVGSEIVALVSGGGTGTSTGGGTTPPPSTTPVTVKIDNQDSKTFTSLPLASGATIGALSLNINNPAQSFALGNNPGGFWTIQNGNVLRVNRSVTTSDNGTYNLTITGVDGSGNAFSDSIQIIISGTVSQPSSTQLNVHVPQNNPSNVTAFENWLGRQVDGVHAFTSGSIPGDWNGPNPNWQLSSEFLYGAGRKLVWSIPMTPDNAGVAEYQQVANGDHNSRYAEWATLILNSRSGDSDPIYVRTTWELGGEWFPWTHVAQEDGTVFVNAWRQWANAWHGVSSRFKMVWDFTADRGAVEQWYPGNAYVDVISQDIYWQPQWQGNDPAAAFQYAVYGYGRGLDWQRNFCITNGKPVAISEFAVNGDAGGPFISGMRDWILAQQSSPGAAYLTYWNDHQDSGYDGYMSDNGMPNAGDALKQLWAAIKGTGVAPPPPSSFAVKIDGQDSKTITGLPFAAYDSIGTLTVTTNGPAQMFWIDGNPGGFWAVQNGNRLTVNREITSGDAGSYTVTIGGIDANGDGFSDAVTIVFTA